MNLFDVAIVNVKGVIDYRDTKYCVCVSILKDKYLLINTEHRSMYDDFKIEAKDYPFLQNEDRFVSCSKIHTFDFRRIIKSVGNLEIKDIKKIIEKIRNSRSIHKIDKDLILPELENWLSENRKISDG